MVDVEVWGSGGFAGQELVGMLKNHPEVRDISTPGRQTTEYGYEPAEVAFLALPQGISGAQAKKSSEAGAKVIDLSGDLRFSTAQEYERWYDEPHPAPEVLPVQYALPEHFRQDINGKEVLSMPGCYPTASLLGILPLLKEGLIQDGSDIVIDAMSGVTGRGKEPTEMTHFVTMHDNAITYKAGRKHRHVGEIEQFLQGHQVLFSPTVIPVERGLITKASVRLGDVSTNDAVDALSEAYSDEPFVKVHAPNVLPTMKETIRTDTCHIGLVAIAGMVQVVSSLDNLRKGASSQAVQAFNIMQGFDETLGLTPVK